ncbi:MAG: gamma-glutamyltransferase, partial [Thermoanaerobaculia bacterium]
MKPHRTWAVLCALGALLAAPPATASSGAVVTGEAEATRAGVALLEAGGNAVDAAVGAALVLAVVH